MIEKIKFLITGVTNTAIDFIFLNLFIIVFGLAEGDPKYIPFKAVSYLAASANSFVLNKWWVFKNKAGADKKEVGSFAIVTATGLLLNTMISLAVFHGGTLFFPAANVHLWANIGALSGTALVLLFNFFSYKLIVFKK